jgi:hypothetical protein
MPRRARHNVEVIVGRLTGQGYRFHANDHTRTPVVPWAPPTAQAAQHAAWPQERFGPVPMTVWLGGVTGDVVQVPLPGVGAALAVLGAVLGEELVQHRHVARGEVTVDALGGHPPIQGAGGLGVPDDRLLLERPLVLVGLRPQPHAELADLHLPQLLGADLTHHWHRSRLNGRRLGGRHRR